MVIYLPRRTRKIDTCVWSAATSVFILPPGKSPETPVGKQHDNTNSSDHINQPWSIVCTKLHEPKSSPIPPPSRLPLACVKSISPSDPTECLVRRRGASVNIVPAGRRVAWSNLWPLYLCNLWSLYPCNITQLCGHVMCNITQLCGHVMTLSDS